MMKLCEEVPRVVVVVELLMTYCPSIVNVARDDLPCVSTKSP